MRGLFQKLCKASDLAPEPPPLDSPPPAMAPSPHTLPTTIASSPSTTVVIDTIPRAVDTIATDTIVTDTITQVTDTISQVTDSQVTGTNPQATDTISQATDTPSVSAASSADAREASFPVVDAFSFPVPDATPRVLEALTVAPLNDSNPPPVEVPNPHTLSDAHAADSPPVENAVPDSGSFIVPNDAVTITNGTAVTTTTSATDAALHGSDPSTPEEAPVVLHAPQVEVSRSEQYKDEGPIVRGICHYFERVLQGDLPEGLVTVTRQIIGKSPAATTHFAPMQPPVLFPFSPCFIHKSEKSPVHA